MISQIEHMYANLKNVFHLERQEEKGKKLEYATLERFHFKTISTMCPSPKDIIHLLSCPLSTLSSTYHIRRNILPQVGRYFLSHPVHKCVCIAWVGN